MVEIIEKLKKGDRHSIDRSAEVIQDVLDDPTLFETVLRATLHEDPWVRMRATDVVEKVTALHPYHLQTHKDLILGEIAQIQQPEVRCHVAQTLPRLDLNQEEVQVAIDILKTYLKDDSRIVRTFAMNSLAFFAENDPTLEPWVITLIEELIEDGTPAMQSRGRKLLARLKSIGRE
jgi:hypothetical protein